MRELRRERVCGARYWYDDKRGAIGGNDEGVVVGVVVGGGVGAGVAMDDDGGI